MERMEVAFAENRVHLGDIKSLIQWAAARCLAHGSELFKEGHWSNQRLAHLYFGAKTGLKAFYEPDVWGDHTQIKCDWDDLI